MKLIQLLLLIGTLSFYSCKEEIDIATPEFEVSTESKSYKVNEEVNFNFEGNPDFISFYSGEVGHDYFYKDNRIIDKGIVKLSFNTNVQYGTQAGMFSVMASTDFDGDYSDISHVTAATWTDITNRFTLATSTAFTNSGEVDISDLVEDGKPLYIAYKLTVRDADLYGAWRVWRIQAYRLTTETVLGTTVLGDMNTSGFQMVDKDPLGPSKTRSSVTAATLSLYTAVVTNENRNVDTETWIISGAFNAGKFEAGPDRPIAIKGNVTGYTANYKYTFTKPGTYKCYFVASNNNIYGAKEVVREIEVNIEP